MRKEVFILIGAVLLSVASLRGQCPERAGLWKRITYLRDSSRLPHKEKIAKLLDISDSLNSCPSKNDSTHSLVLSAIARLYFNQADYLKGVQYFRQSINIIVTNAGKPSINEAHLTGRYYWLSRCYDSLNNFNEKMKALDNCSRIAIKLKYVDRACLKALETWVQYFFDIGDYHRCIDYAVKCQLLGREYANKNSGLEKKVGELCVSNNLGWQVKALLRLKEFEEAESLLANKVDEYTKTGLKNYLGLIYGQLAEVEEYQGSYEQALSYFNKSLKYYEETGDYFNCKQISKDVGYKIYFKHYGNGDKALANYKKALRYINKERTRSLADIFETVDIFANIGRVHVQKGSYDSALKYYQLAFDQIKGGSNEEDILQSAQHEMVKFKKNYYLTSLVIDKGDAFRKKYVATKQESDARHALRIYKTADQLLDRIKAEQTELESKLFWRSDSRRLYENAIEACYLQNNFNDAFYFFERSRAVLLNDQLNEQRWLGENDILKQNQAKKRILHLEREYHSVQKTSPRYIELQNELFNSKQELEQLQQTIRKTDPLYYQSFVDTNVITIRDVQVKILKDHQGLVELFEGDSAIYALIITAQAVNFKKIDKDLFENLSRSFNSYISNHDSINKSYREFIKVASGLYKLIFQNVDLPIGRIIISPDGQYFPFEALVTGIANDLPVYFLRDHAVSYTYSARYLLNSFGKSDISSYSFLGIAPVRYAGSMELPALRGSDESLGRLRTYFGKHHHLIAADASKKNFIQQFSEYRIIQFYTHATDSGAKGEPEIYFTDSALLLSDLIYDKRPITSLIVLSACETGLGKIHRGEGVFSFNRGFAAIGIPSSITNLWRVDNNSTYRLTELFYKWLDKELPIDVALQKAKLEFIETSSREEELPYYWAAPVLIGQSNAIKIEKAFPWKYASITVIAALLLWAGWRLRRTRKSLNPIRGTKETLS